MGMKTLDQVAVQKRVVLVRGDLDVGEVAKASFEDFRLKAMLPTLKFLLENQATVILIGHRDRPQGQVIESLRTKPLQDWLQAQGLSCYYTQQVVCSKKIIAEHLQKIILLENIRFDPREERDDLNLAQEWAALAQAYVNECFATSHRKHASFVSIAKLLPSAAGFHLATEVRTLSQIMTNPLRPLVFVMGGAKTATKMPVIKKVSSLANTILLGGKLMFEQSLEGIPHVRYAQDARRINDIGAKSEELFIKYIKAAQTVVWNGPLGEYEQEEYAKGTARIAQVLYQKAQAGTRVVIGGGDTIAALHQLGFLTKFESLKSVFISTGGGAMLQYLAGDTLPGLEALEGK